MTVAATTQTSLSCPKHDALLPQSLLYNIITTKLSEAFELTMFHANISHYSDNLTLIKKEEQEIPAYRFAPLNQPGGPHLDLILPSTPLKNLNQNGKCYSPDSYQAPKRQRLNSIPKTPSSPDVHKVLGLNKKQPGNLYQCPNCKAKYKQKRHFDNHTRNCTIPLFNKPLMEVCRELTFEKECRTFANDLPAPSENKTPDASSSSERAVTRSEENKEELSQHLHDRHSFAIPEIKNNDQSSVQFRLVDDEMVAYFGQVEGVKQELTKEQPENKHDSNLSSKTEQKSVDDSHLPSTVKRNQDSTKSPDSSLNNTKKSSKRSKSLINELTEIELNKMTSLKYDSRPKRLAAIKNSHCKTKKVQSATKILENVKKCKQAKKLSISPSKKPSLSTSKHSNISDNGRHECEHCSCKFEAIWSLKRHQYTVHGIGHPLTSDDVATRQSTAECQECVFSPASLTTVFNRMCEEVPNSIQQDTKYFKCGLCGLHFPSRAVLTRHKRSHRDPSNTPALVDGKYLCYICFVTFDTYKKLQTHENTHKVRSPLCAVCNKTFPSLGILKSHKCSLLKSDVEIKCTHCSRVFTSGSEHTKHLKQAHSNIQQTFRSTLCKMCDYTFSSVLKYKVHRTTAHPTPNFACQLCFATLADKGSLVSHITQEHHTEPFLCTVCEKGFNEQSSLSQHMSQHFK